MEDEEAWPAARLRDCQISRDLSVWALELNHRHLSHRRDGRVADSTLEPTLEWTPQVDAASEDPKGGRIGFEHAASTFHYPSFLTIFREMPQAGGSMVRKSPDCLRGCLPSGRLALHDGHPFDHAREGPRVPTTCHVPAQALTAGPSRRCRLRGTSRQRSSIRGPGAPRARKGRIGIRLEGSSVRSGVGPRGAVYVVPSRDVAVFTLGRSPRNPVLATAVRAAAEKAKRAFRNRQAQPERFVSNRAAGVNFRELRIASMTGTLRIEWDGATTSWRLVEPPTEAAEPARLELARRFLRSVGPSTPQEFAWWSGGWAGSYGASTRGELSDAQQTFRSLEKELTEVEVAGRKQWALRTDRVRLERAVPVETVRLLPAGDPFLASADRALLVPQPRFRSELWPNSVWPGALLVNGDLVGTWRRQVGRVTVRAWRPLEPEVKEAVEEEVSRMPIESATKEVRWSTGHGPL